MTRYLPSRNYFYLGVTALALAALSSLIVSRWTVAAIPAGLFVASAALNFVLATRPTIVLTQHDITIGGKTIRWQYIERIDRTGWVSPLIVWLTLTDGSRRLLVYPGALQGSRKLSADLDRRLAASRAQEPHPALIASAESAGAAAVRHPLLNAEDEAEVERLFQRLKSVGHLEQEDR